MQLLVSSYSAPLATRPSTLLGSMSRAWLSSFLACSNSPFLKCFTPMATLYQVSGGHGQGTHQQCSGNLRVHRPLVTLSLPQGVVVV